MFRRFAAPFLVVFVVISLILHCQIPQDPADPSNTTVELLIRNSHWLESNLSITDTVDKPIQIGVVICLPENIDSIRLSVKAEGKSLFDTLLQSFSSGNKDTIWKAMSFTDSGDKFISIVPYSQVIKLSPVSAGITIVNKTSIIQSVNYPPKWTENTLNVALNDTAQYELNLSSWCSDPDKDVLHYAISGKTLPGDTIIDSLYKFQASTATIGKNSVELIASDPSGQKDTMVLVLNVTVAGTDNSPPEVTIIAPDRDSGVTNSENYVVDLLCSDASGIDSVYAVFNSKTTSAVLVNGRYKISITGLAEGVYNTIQITVSDKSISALKTTKTIKIKYAQIFTIAYNGNGNSSGVIPTDTGKYETGVIATVKSNTGNLVKTEFTFAGWNTAADGSGTTYAEGSTFKMGSGNVTLYVAWNAITYTLCYDGNGNSGGSAPTSVSGIVSGASVTVSGAGFLVRTGYEFLGWSTDRLATTAKYNSSTPEIVITANTTLYAIWKLLPTYTVTYNANGGGDESAHGAGLVPTDSKVYTTDAIVAVLGNPGNLKKTGYVFYGWTKIANDTTTLSSFRMGSANVTLYARWAIMDASGNEYTEVKIGDQVWMVENLRTTMYRDGTPIEFDTSSATWISGEIGKYCFYNNTTNIDTIRKFGALYNGFAVDTKNLAPLGWHVPDSNEVIQLQNYLIQNGYNADGKRSGNTVAKALASKTDWVDDTTTNSIGRNLNENNKTGFTAYPAGGRGDLFANMGSNCWFWVATKYPDDNLFGLWFHLTNTSAEMQIGPWLRCFGFSVRAVRDW